MESIKTPNSGGIKELIYLFLPLLATSFSNYLFLLVEKIFLARFSPLAMQAAINAAYACQIFQGASLAVVTMAQVFVGRWYGAREWHSIGPGVWQYIWFSFLSAAITIPASLIYGAWYFRGTDIEEIVYPYYCILVVCNFLFPLGATLSSFYLGLGKPKLVLISNLCLQIAKLVIAYFLIFGIGNWLPSLGIIGGALSTVLAQFLFCIVLGTIFLNKQNRTLFQTAHWHFKWKSFWDCIYPGILRASNRISNFTCWASIAHLMVAKGGDYLLFLSLGGSLSLFLPFLFEAICQAQTTIASHILGAKKLAALGKSARSAFLLVSLMSALIGIPFLTFPSFTFHWLFPEVKLGYETISTVFCGVWLSFAMLTLSAVPLSFVLAFKDMKFSFAMGIFNWVNGYLLMYFFIEKMEIAPQNFWTALSVMHGTTALIYIWRMRYLFKKENYLLQHQFSKV